MCLLFVVRNETMSFPWWKRAAVRSSAGTNNGIARIKILIGGEVSYRDPSSCIVNEFELNIINTFYERRHTHTHTRTQFVILNKNYF